MCCILSVGPLLVPSIKLPEQVPRDFNLVFKQACRALPTQYGAVDLRLVVHTVAEYVVAQGH